MCVKSILGQKTSKTLRNVGYFFDRGRRLLLTERFYVFVYSAIQMLHATVQYFVAKLSCFKARIKQDRNVNKS